jgi:twitching motility protein PilT
MAMTLIDLLKAATELGGSDLHLSAGSPPQVRVDGHLRRLAVPPLSGDAVRRLCEDTLADADQRAFQATFELDTAIDVDGVGRVRCNLFRQRRTVGAVFRLIPGRVPSLDDLGFPPIVAELTGRPRGLVLVTGPTGSGKSTTLAAMVDRINSTTPAHILTIEDPVEYVHTHKMGLVNQRELHTDTGSYAMALRAALREDPDVVLVGEMRDTETMAAALKLAETGHLTLASLHTNSAAQTITRIVDAFPAHQQGQIRVQLSLVLQGIVCQMLIGHASGAGRAVALEVLVASSAVRNLIREDKVHQLYGAMQVGQDRVGMQTMNQSLARLVERRVITRESALKSSSSPDELVLMLARNGTGETVSGARAVSAGATS